MSNAALIFGHDAGETPPAGSIGCHLGQALELSHRQLEAYCVRQLEPVDIDLLVTGGLLAFADRSVTRRRASGWARQLTVRVPVLDLDRWSNPEVSKALVKCLRSLTGDVWHLKFQQRSHGSVDGRLLSFKQERESPGVVLPYSDGLDSFAGFRLHNNSNEKVWLVTMEHGSRVGVGSRRTQQEWSGKHHALQVPLHFRGLDHPEQTFRTRAFLFLISAAVACRLTGANRIAIAENGQGAIGPWLVPVGNEHPYSSSHPRFTRSLRSFLKTLWDGWAPRFDHPNLWRVKSSLLRELKKRNLLSGWHETNSCSRNIQRDKGGNSPAACGLCGGCLLRRVSAAAAGVHDPTEYFFADLSRSTIESMVTCQPKRPVGSNDTDHCAHAVLNMGNFAAVAKWPRSHSSWQQGVFDLSRSVGDAPAVVEEDLKSLVLQHRDDWHSFLRQLPAESWIAQSAQEVCSVR